jgi:vacuolar-type H+-ATPase subunit I/STV1
MISKIANLGKSYLTSAFSGYMSIIIAAGCGILLTYLVTLNTTISSQKKQIKELSGSLGSCNQKVINERERANNQVDTDILIKNNETLTEENKRLLDSNKKLSELNKDKENDNKKVSEELNKLRNKKCLNTVVDQDTVDSLNKIFNGE